MKRMKMWSRKAGAGTAAAALTVSMILGGAPVYAAASGIDMSTDYPGIMVKAGETVSFPLDFASLDGEGHDVALSSESLPENWKGYFKSSTSEITKVHVDSSSESTDDTGKSAGKNDGKGMADYSLTVPAEAENGTYTVALKADGGSGNTDTLELEVTVSEEQAGESNFSSEYPEQQGASGTTFNFDTTIVNNRGTNQSYSLAAEAPDGWQVAFTPASESNNVASLAVDAGASQGLKVTVTPPENVEKGEYKIPCTAVSANDTLKTELTVSITGTYGLTLTTPDQRLSFDAYANKESSVKLTLTNTGNVDLNNLNLTSSAPTGWEVRFSESMIDTLKAGASMEVTAYVKPSKDAVTGDYVSTLTATSSETSSSADFRVSVKTSTTWGIVAAAVLVVLVGGLGFIFKKYGRR